MKTVIGLIGVKTSGKSTVANLIKEFIPNSIEVALADKLKDTCSTVFNIERDRFDKQELKEVLFETPIELSWDHIKSILNSFYIDTNGDALSKLSKIQGAVLVTPRHIAQIVGTEILRTVGHGDIHCDFVDLKNNISIVSDVRFENELDYFLRKDDIKFLPLYISRDEAESVVNEDSHLSEKGVFEFRNRCIKVDNNQSINSLKGLVHSQLTRSGLC